MKLYYDPITVNCRKVVAGLDLIGASYDEERVNYFGGEHKLPAYMKINPNGELPALVDDDLVLWESNAIMVYACEKLGRTTPRSAPTSRAGCCGNRANGAPPATSIWWRTWSSRSLTTHPTRP